jgi:biotin transport system substrate-specific component
MKTAPIARRFWAAAQPYQALRLAVLALAGSLVVAAAAQITVPMWPVPMTLQTLAVLAVGAAYGARLGAATLGLYALEGAIGLPFFAGAKSGIGDDKLAYFLPASSMGYVLGFVLAAAVVGYLVEKGWGASLVKTVAATLIGAAVLYVPGLIWLAIWAAKSMAMDAGTALSSALAWGLYPFVLGDVLKAVIAGAGIGAVGFGLRK